MDHAGDGWYGLEMGYHGWKMVPLVSRWLVWFGDGLPWLEDGSSRFEMVGMVLRWVTMVGSWFLSFREGWYGLEMSYHGWKMVSVI